MDRTSPPGPAPPGRGHAGDLDVKTHVIWLLAGAILGAVAASIVVPPTISWYASPGGLPKGAHVQVIADMPVIIKYATSKLILGQAIGAGIGAVACFGFSIYVASKRRKGAPAA
jgi:hypothetical protein